MKSSSDDSITGKSLKSSKEPSSSTEFNRETHPERVLRLSVDHIRKAFGIFKNKNFRKFIFFSKFIFFEILKIEKKGWVKKFQILRQLQIQMNTGSLLIRVLSYNMNRSDLSRKITILSLFLVIYHFRTRLNMFVTNGACHPNYKRF